MLCNLSDTARVLIKVKVSLTSHKAQIGDGISGIHLYYDIRHNRDDRICSCTRVQHFTPREIT